MKPKVIVVSKKTLYSSYIEDENDHLVYEFLKTGHPAVARWKKSHDNHNMTLEAVCKIVEENAKLFLIDTPQTSFVADLQDVALVVTVGGDGTLLSASHNIHKGIPILGVNSDPDTSVGFFCAAVLETFSNYLHMALEGKCPGISLTRMKVTKNKQIITSRVLNDVLFCHKNPATTSSYILSVRRSSGIRCPLEGESQKSSGFWVGPAAGSTAARRSAGFNPILLGSKSLQLCVRELYYKPNSQPGTREIVTGSQDQIHVTSKMDLAAMYIDGDYKVVPVGLGDELIFEKSDDSLFLLGKTDVPS